MRVKRICKKDYWVEAKIFLRKGFIYEISDELHCPYYKIYLTQTKFLNFKKPYYMYERPSKYNAVSYMPPIEDYFHLSKVDDRKERIKIVVP